MSEHNPLPRNVRHKPHHAESVWPILLILALLAVVPVVATMLDDLFLLRFFTRAVIFSIAAVALNIALGYGAMVSLAHGAFMGLGGYTIGVLASADFFSEPLVSVPFAIGGTSDLLVSVPVAVAVSAGFAAIIGLICLRTTGMYFIMITLAFNQMLYFLFVAWERFGGEDGLQILSKLRVSDMDPTGRIPFFYICVATLGLVLLFTNRLARSPFGLVLRGISQNETRMTAVGIPVFVYRWVAFTISGALTGLAGAYLAISQMFVSPVDLYWIRSADLVVMAVLGGISVAWGPVVGAFFFLAAELLLSSWSIYWNMLLGSFIILVAIFLPSGLALFSPLRLLRTYRRSSDG